MGVYGILEIRAIAAHYMAVDCWRSAVGGWRLAVGDEAVDMTTQEELPAGPMPSAGAPTDDVYLP
jgi:hypothetical protein